MLEKLKSAFPGAGTPEFLWIFGAIVAYHLFLFTFFYFLIVVPIRTKMRTMKMHVLEEKKRLEEAWKDREEEQRILLHQEKEQEILQLKAEYDSYVKLLEQKLHRAMSKES
jgi:predicted Holliday junction resolvase-like endonuclease